MFQKPAFGANTSNFGSFNSGTAAASPFGSFKPTTAAGGFGAPAFGAGASTQPATGGGLFGATNTTGGLFGNTAASTSTAGFGASTSGFGFGANPTSGGLFGANTSNAGGGLFGNTQNQSAFGAKPAGFGFGATPAAAPATGGLFGATPSTGSNLFGQQNNTMGGGGLFSNTTSAFGQPQTATGTAQVKYNPVVGTDVVVKSGQSQNVNIKHHCITCMKEYENKSLEELRLEDYLAGNKGQQSTGAVFGAGPFGQQTENKPLFPAQSAFSQPASTSAPSVFSGAAPAFGQTSSFSFGGAAPGANNSLFAANKPAFGAATTPGTGLFGAPTTQAQPATSSFGFGANTSQAQPTGGLFGAKPVTGFGNTTGAFGATSTALTPFGTGGGLFGAKGATATPAPAFGTMSGGFGTNTSTAGGLFGGGSTFGKPTTTQPAFGFNTQPTGLGAGLGAGVGANTFQTKPATAGFGALNTGGMFQQPAPATTFKTGLEGGLGGGMFNNASTLGGSALGMGSMNANTSALANNSLSGASAAGNVHEQILTLAARPYGDSPLFKDLLPDSSTTAEDVLKPTNPVAVQAVLDKCQYRVTSPTSVRLTVHPRTVTASDKKSLFDGLEESDPSLEDKLCLKPSRKRLVLRPNTRTDHLDSSVTHNDSERSIEEQPQSNGPRESQTERDTNRPNTDVVDKARRHVDFPDNNADVSSDRHGSWLSSSKMPWSDKEKSIDGEPTPRLYPNIDKDLQAQVSERRASWLTTKPLRKPLVPNPDSAENSVRELGVRNDRSYDKENIDTLSVSEEENVSPQPTAAPPHPTGVKLTRPGYYTIPSLDDMIPYMRQDGSCVVPHLTIGRKNYGNVYYDCEIDVAGLDLDSLVHFMNKEVIVYPEESVKPPLGSGLNRRAIVTLDRIWPRDKTEKRPITDPNRLIKMDYEGKLRRVCDKHDTKFIEYRPESGSWVFRVEHFSKYGLTDSDEEEDIPDVLRRQLAAEKLQGQAAAPPPAVRNMASPGLAATLNSSGLGGLGGLGLGGLGVGANLAGPNLGGLGGSGMLPEDNLFAMQQTSLNLLNGAGKAFEMDTTEDNAESQSLYMDNKAYGVKSPTSELARLEHRQSHNVQLMKASLYTDTEMDDDASVSTGDQLVPVSNTLCTLTTKRASIIQEDDEMTHIPAIESEETPMKPLIVRPHTIVLKYHRKVPPFKETIAGRLNAAYISDMSVARARHSRVGFGPAGVITFATTYNSVNDLAKSAELCDLNKYVRGRSTTDWSEPVVVRMALGHTDPKDTVQEVLKKQLDTLLEHSTLNEVVGQCPQLKLAQSPRARHETLCEWQTHTQQNNVKFGVSGAYCNEVWRLCDALWGADLENDGIPGTDTLSIVNRHKKLLEWFKAAVSEQTDKDLAVPRKGEAEDEEDGHSAQIWLLLLGGRILEACKVAKEHGDLNMAILIAQAAGDPTFRGLISRQLSQWQQCGAAHTIAAHRWASLQLLAGHAARRDQLLQCDWLRALHATARYLCSPIPSLEQVMRTYESLFTTTDDEDDDGVDLTVVETDDMCMKLPLPPYVAQYDVTVVNNGQKRRILDLRYELLRARAYNSRPKLTPASYTPDPMDYSLCFLLGTWFGNPSVESVLGTAEQLEAGGAWHRAVLVLMYHPDHTARGHLIRGMLNRHAPSKADTPDLQERLALIRRLKVPEQWLMLAQAVRAKYERLPSLEAEYLAGAEQWNAAHKVLLDELLPEAVLADNLHSIYPLLERMNEAAARHEVSGWESGGQALYHYIQVCDEIRGLVSSPEAQDRSHVTSRLEAMRPKVAAACKALGGLQPTTARGRLARTEMGARLVALALAGGAASRAAGLLRALRLPPDSTHHKISSMLAESSAPTSPPIHRAAAS